jgi:hypothetical protein
MSSPGGRRARNAIISSLQWQADHVSMHHLLPDRLLEPSMTTYLPAYVWLLSAVVCLAIGKRRNVKLTTTLTILAALIGPFAIPFVLFAKPQEIKLA